MFMKNFFTMQDSLENKISFYHLAGFLVLLPFDRFYSELILISLTFHTIIHLDKQKLQRIFTWQNLLLSSVIMLNCVGWVWSGDKAEAIKDMQRQLAIILFPFILSATGLPLSQYRKRLFMLFGIGCILAVIYLYADALHIIFYDHLPLKSLFYPYFINQNFSMPIGIHATYLAMYTALAIAIFISLVLEEKKKGTRSFYATALIILFAGLIQLASKSVLIATLIYISIGFPFFVLTRNKRTKFIIVAIVISLLVFFAITRIDSFEKRYVSELKDEMVQRVANNETAEPRITRWRFALQLVQQFPVAGSGSGSEKRLLKEKYFENKLFISYLHELNAHNQYLSILIKQGILGLIVFLFTIITGFYMALKRRDIVFAGFMIIISIVSFFENILDVNKGIFFYAFFFSFFILNSKPFYEVSRFSKEQAGLPV